MKKRFYQILLMGAVTVSLGLFVSCKDTSADLYKQLEWQIDEKASLEDVTQMQLDQLNLLKQYIQDQLALIEKCNCPKNMAQTIQELTDFMNKMNQAAADNDNSFETLKELLQGITNNYETVNNFFNNLGVSEAELNQAVQDLEAKINAIKKCECDLSKLAQIEQAANDAYTLAHKADSTVNVAMKIANDAKTAAEDAKSQVQTLSTQVQQALDKAGAADSIAKETKALVSSLDSIAKAADKLSKENAEKIQQNADAISNMKVQMVAFSDSLKHAYETADQAYAQAFSNKTAIELMDSAVNAHKTAIEDLKTATAKIPALEGAVTTLSNKVDSIGIEIDTLKAEIKKVYDYADANLIKAKEYTDLQINLVKLEFAKNLADSIAAVNGEISKINISVQDLRNKLDDEVEDLWAEITKLQQKDVEISENLEAYKDSTDQKINNALADIVNINKVIDLVNDSLGALEAKIDGNTTLIREVEDKLKNAMDEFQDKIDLLQAQIDSVGLCVAENTEAIDKLTGAFGILQENLKRQVTGILVQGTYNPAFGTINLPVGIQSNVLLTYYGEAALNVEFPTSSTANYVDDKYALSAKDMEMLGLKGKEPLYKAAAGDVILQNEKNNAGTLFLTVNPNTVDFSKLQLSLVNSQDKESYIKLGELTRSDRTLQLGYSRAADNGFYECAANLAAEDVNKVQKVNFNTSALKEAIEEIVNKRTSADVSKVASDMAEVIRGLRIDANAVKCEWTDSAKAGETPQTHAVYSNYNLAATAVKPLSLQTAKDFHYQTVPGYERAMELLDSVSKSLHGAVKTVYKEFNSSDLIKDVGDLKINHVVVADLTESQKALFRVDIDTTIEIGGLSYHLDLNETVNVPVKFNKDVTVPIHIDEDVAIDMSNLNVKTPTIVVTTDVKNGSGGATLVVPVNTKVTDKVTGEPKDSLIGNAIVDLNQIDVDAKAKIDGGTITLDGTAVAHFTYDKDQVVNINVDETVQTTVNIEKWIYFGDYKLDADGNIVYDGDGNPIHTDKKSVRIWVKKDLSNAAESLWGSAQQAIGGVNDMLDDLNNIVDDVNDMITKINSYQEKIDTKIDTYMDKVVSFVNKINKKIVDFVNSTNQRLQPTLIASDGNGAKMLSEAKNYPTVFEGGEISFVPTTWTLELVVPIAKKHVAVTDVIVGGKSAKGGDTTCKNELSRVNESPTLNVLLSGEQRRAYASNLKSGYTYEVAYSALDFHGKMATRKYYITIK